MVYNIYIYIYILCKHAIKSKQTRIIKNLQVSRDCYKIKETMNKILAQEKTKV